MSNKHTTTLIKTLCARGALRDARALFDEMPNRDVVAWTAMISGYASNGYHRNALDTFRRMVSAGVGPNEFTLSSVLTACRGGRTALHAVAVRRGVDDAPYVVNALIDAYASCGEGVGDARRLFDAMEGARTAASWTSMIAGYARWGWEHAGLRLFQRMIQDGVELSPFTCSVAIHACASVAHLHFGQQLHAVSKKHGLEANLVVANSLIDMYCRSTSLAEARRCFDGMPARNLVTWNTAIAGVGRCNPQEALQLFLEMGLRDVEPNCFTLTSVTSACASLAALRCGHQAHGAVLRRGFGEDLQMCNALVDMYSKSGSVESARMVFDGMPSKDILSWTSMMIGYGMNGCGHEAIRLFDDMVRAGMHPDHVVFMGLISACSHAGLVDKGWNYFKSMSSEYNVQPNKEVYGCVTDLLGRAGRLREAFELIEAMPFAPDESIWGALLGSCKMHKNTELGRLAAKKIIELKPEGAKTYVLLANIYAAGSEWGEYAATRRLLKGTGSRKEAGMSWIEVTDKMYSFVAADSSNPHVGCATEVLQILAQHMDEAGLDFVDDFEAVT